ncbi:MAG TPA: phosphoglucosamine mutase, partial [Planctomycetota bacterium]|nr:phosphoglucosamine mutase [Planctomycetota bacterium]
MDKAIFGTDGIRGRAGSGWLSPEGAAQVGWAVGSVLSQQGSTRALLAHDGRRSGPTLETALACGLAAAGVASDSAGLLPTPGLAWLTRHDHYGLGIMVSASHNPAHDNGIKVFNHEGDKLADEVQNAIEALLRAPHPEIEYHAKKRPPHVPELEDHYLRHLEHNWGAGLDLNGWTVVVDCANGAASRSAPKILTRLGARVHAIADEPDGENINLDCGSTHPEALRDAVRTRQANVGIALDGDGDRCLLVDERGRLVDGDAILMILAQHARSEVELPKQRIVATVMSNRGLHRALRKSGVGIIEVGVGDRNVVEALRREGLGLGGEQSGHVILGARNEYIGDGMVTALAVLRVLVGSGKSLSQLTAPFESMPQILLNIPVDRKPPMESLEGVQAR